MKTNAKTYNARWVYQKQVKPVQKEEVEQIDEELKTKTAYVPYVYTDKHGSGFGGYDVHYSKENDAHAHSKTWTLDLKWKKVRLKNTRLQNIHPGRWVDANHMRRNGSDSMHEETKSLDEVALLGFEGTVKAMKKHKDITNPFALAWSMKNKGYKSHKKADGSDK
jgi:hypothetical protein